MSISYHKEQNMLVALMHFAKAWEELANASKALPELDVSELYPFFLLDYEAIAPDVKQWCMHQASKLLANIPDRVPNPACVHCPYLFAGLDNLGVCKGQSEVQCDRFPTVPFDRTSLLPFCQLHDIKTDNVSDEIMQLNYTRKVKEINEEENSNGCASPGDSTPDGHSDNLHCSAQSASSSN